jgi:hypothetical protein
MDGATLEFLAQQQRRILDEIAAIRVDLQDLRDARERSREDVAVMTAMALRLENSLAREARSLHSRFDFLDHRLARTEQAARGNL